MSTRDPADRQGPGPVARATWRLVPRSLTAAQVGTGQQLLLRRAAPLELELLEFVLAPIDTATLAGQRDRRCCSASPPRFVAPSSSRWTSRILSFDTARGLNPTSSRRARTSRSEAAAADARRTTSAPVPYARETDRCAVRALSQWLQAAKDPPRRCSARMRRGDTVGQERLTDQSVALISKSRAECTGRFYDVVAPQHLQFAGDYP
ncbi:MAG: hypothetical protein ACLP50_30470 [Solirubrobacteraceae bacterium]